MGHILKLEIPDELYEALRNAAEQKGTTLEEIAAERLARTAPRADDDPLLRLAGILDSELKDVADLHDGYIGAALADEVRPSGRS